MGLRKEDNELREELNKALLKCVLTVLTKSWRKSLILMFMAVNHRRCR